MFIAALLALPLGMATEGAGIVLVAIVFLPVILLWMRLVQAFMRIFFDKDTKREKNVYAPPQPAFNPVPASTSALPPAQNAPVVEPHTNRMKDAEMAEPLSVTENTTELLKNRRSH
jgi:Na+-transporting methylmalonyl-CoA/oxaloacetate decarboxylase gamma subunit